jgi:hypothetical protein
MMRSKGRPPVSPVRLKDGFYIEVYEKGSKSGMKIRSDTKKNMETTADRYIQSKRVVVLGEYKDGVPVSK